MKQLKVGRSIEEQLQIDEMLWDGNHMMTGEPFNKTKARAMYDLTTHHRKKLSIKKKPRIIRKKS